MHHEHKEQHICFMKKEKSVSRPAISPFDAAELIECRVDKYSTVVIKQNHYSVPEGHVGKYIKAKVGAETIKLFIDGELDGSTSTELGGTPMGNEYLPLFKNISKEKRCPRSKRMLEAGTNTNKKLIHHVLYRKREGIHRATFLYPKT